MNKNGFSIVESLVSVILLSICLAGGISLYHHADQLTSLFIHKKIVNEIANSTMEGLKNTSYNSIAFGSSSTNPFITTEINVGGLSATTTTLVEPVNDAGAVVSPGAETFKRATITVTWNEALEAGTSRTYQIVTYIAKL